MKDEINVSAFPGSCFTEDIMGWLWKYHMAIYSKMITFYNARSMPRARKMKGMFL